MIAYEPTKGGAFRKSAISALALMRNLATYVEPAAIAISCSCVELRSALNDCVTAMVPFTSTVQVRSRLCSMRNTRARPHSPPWATFEAQHDAAKAMGGSWQPRSIKTSRGGLESRSSVCTSARAAWTPFVSAGAAEVAASGQK